MAGIDFPFNAVLGKIRYYLELPAANDGLFLAVLEATAIEADGTLRDYDTLAALLAGTSNEMSFTGYARHVITPAAAAVDDVNNWVDVDGTDAATWTNTDASSVQSGKALLCYDPDVSVGDDSTVLPLFAYACSITFEQNVDTALPFDAAGMARFQAG